MKPIRLTKNKPGDLGDVRYTSQFLVAPGSYIDKKPYKIIKDKPIARVTEKQIRKAFSSLTKKESIPFSCYNSILIDSESKSWKARGYLVLYLKTKLGMNEDQITVFLKENNNWSDFNPAKTSQMVRYEFERLKEKKIKGLIKKSTLIKEGYCKDNCEICLYKKEKKVPATYEKITYQKKTLEECKSVIKTWLHIEDKDVLDIVFACAKSEKIPGDPLWLFLIAPPGGCKTEILRAMDGGDYYHLSDLTSKTFVSGLMIGSGEQRQKIEDLLPQLKDKVLVMKDFTTILEKQKDERREIIAQLREIYDGMFSKKFGTLDHKVEYKNNFGFIAGVTPIIDKHWKIMQQLGERFLKYRWNEDEDATTRKAEENEGKESVMRKELKEAVMGFLDNVEIPKQITVSSDLIEPLIQVAKFLALCRTPVTIQSTHSDFYFDFIPTPEKPTRLVKQLKKFSKCLAVVRGRSAVMEEDIVTIIKLALSTAPQDRLDILRAIEELQHSSMYGCTVPQIAKSVPLPRTSIGNICQQLEILRLVEIHVVSDNSQGYVNTVSHYKLDEKITALTPPAFLDMSKKVGGDDALDKWDSKAIVWQQCQASNSGNLCGNSPCNEFRGRYFCEKHFEVIQKLY